MTTSFILIRSKACLTPFDNTEETIGKKFFVHMM